MEFSQQAASENKALQVHFASPSDVHRSHLSTLLKLFSFTSDLLEDPNPCKLKLANLYKP